MSTLNFDTWKDSAGSREFAPCTAWVNFNGTGTVAIRGQLNVSSITDNGVGDYTVNFTTALADANYAAIVSRGSDTSAVGEIAMAKSNQGTPVPTTTAIGITCSNSAASALNDAAFVQLVIFGGI